MTNLNGLRIAYVPTSSDLSGPGDVRRFCHYARRRGLAFEIARAGERYDLVVVTDRGDLSYWARCPRPTRIVYDIMDAYLAVPMTDPKGLLRGLAKFLVGQSRFLVLDHREAIAHLCKRADAVIVNTSEQRGRVAPFCRNIHQILDTQSTYRARKSHYNSGPVFNIGWEGLPENLAPFVSLARVFRKLEERRPIALHIVTKPRFKRFMGRFIDHMTAPIVNRIHSRSYLYDWDPDTVAGILAGCDLAVVPLAMDDALSRGKSANKLLLFWRMGIPTVTSASPAYVTEMENAGVSMACRTEREWHDTLSRYIEDPDARRAAGETGRSYVEREFTEESILRRWDEAPSPALATRRPLSRL